MPGGPAYENCTEVTDFCTVNETVYGYTPSLGANAFFLAWFGLFFFVPIVLAFKFKSWWYNWWIIVGSAGEIAGYGGRVAMHFNPWSTDGFMCQIAALIFSPSFYAAAVYLAVKHVIRGVGAEFSPIRPSLYAWIFIICDLLSLLSQAAGGGVAGGAEDDDTTSLGGDIMLAGIIFQVITFTFLYCLVSCVCWRVYKNRATLKPEVSAMLRSRDFKIFAAGILVASLAIYIRCVYRIAELEGGWANEIMRNEVDYIVLDGVMCAIAVGALCIAHPGIFYQPMLTNDYPSTRGITEKGGFHATPADQRNSPAAMASPEATV